MKMFVVLALAAVACAEPEADPQFFFNPAASPLAYAQRAVVPALASPLLAYNTLPFNTLPYNTLPYAHVAAPAVAAAAAAVEVAGDETKPIVTYNSAVAPAFYNAYNPAVAPIAYTTGAVVPALYNSMHQASPVVYSAATPIAVAPATHTITSYNNPEHYTAISNGAFGPKYIAKNGAVEHVVKREADAEAEAALLYSTYGYNNVAPYSYNNIAAHSYSNLAPYAYSNIAPYTYSNVAPAVTYKHAAPIVTYTHAAPAVTYTHAAPVAAYAASPLVKTVDHAVALTAAGYTHSSNVGICTNVQGVQVPC